MRPEGVSNWYDSSFVRNEAGSSASKGSGTIGTKHAGARSSVSPKVNSGTRASDSTNVEGSESHHGSICGCDCSSAKEVPSMKALHANPSTSPAYTTCGRETLGCSADRPKDSPAHSIKGAIVGTTWQSPGPKERSGLKVEEVCSCLVPCRHGNSWCWHLPHQYWTQQMPRGRNRSKWYRAFNLYTWYQGRDRHIQAIPMWWH